MEFDHWVRAWFDHPDDWGFVTDGADDDELGDIMDLARELSPVETICHATYLFENAGEILRPYRDPQIGHGLYALIWEGGCPLYALRDPLVSKEASCRCLRAIGTVYSEIFAARCTEKLGHLSEEIGDLNGTCYMWWDIFPAYGGCFSEEQNKSVLGVMRRALSLPSAACQESALHGLGHWHHEYPQQVEQIVDVFIASGKERRPELIGYAKSARIGGVQ